MPGIPKERKSFRAQFLGLNTRSQPDSLLPVKYPVAVNVRAAGDSAVQTRPGYELGFRVVEHDSGARGITDIASFSTLGTDNRPRILVHIDSGSVALDTGAIVGSVGTGGPGASMLPFRPSQSPQAWMYVANQTGYQKFQAPNSVTDVVLQQKVGIAEPQLAPDAVPEGFFYNEFTRLAANWTQGGTAGATSDATRSTDTVVAIFADPSAASPPITKVRYSVQVGTPQYQEGETLTFNKSTGGTIKAVVEDVFPPINGGTALTIQAITYLPAGAPGTCVVVPSQQPVDSTIPTFNAVGQPAAGTTFLPGQVAGLRRGSLVQLASEVCLVLSVTTGPQGGIAFQVTTTGTHVAGEAIVGIPAIACSGLTSAVVGQTVAAAEIDSAITVGIGTLSQTLATNPFNLALGAYGTPQANDYVHCSLKIDAPQNVTQIKVEFDIGDGSFTQNALYYAVSIAALQAAVSNTATQLTALQQTAQQDLITSYAVDLTQYPADGSQPDQSTVYERQQLPQVTNTDATQPNAPDFASTGATQWTEVKFPISGLTRVGNDQTKTLANCNAVRITAQVTGSIALGFGSTWIGGGGQPDVGLQGAPYFYRVRPRSALTGARGNPSPATRYGVLPSRQSVLLTLPYGGYDPQIDTWDIFRYGGTALSWRYVGSAASNQGHYFDNVFDDAALAGEVLDFDNFEPWPSVDVPYLATVGDATTQGITVYGTLLNLQTTNPSKIARWLPGTLLTLNGQNTYTLFNRPVSIAGGFLLQTIENMGSPSVQSLSVQEPNIANQILPYCWGPDSNGVVFGVGDPLRPGALASAKQNNPDSTPNNIYDLVQPGEPLMNGLVIDGLSFVASSRRWWALQAAFALPQRWNPIEFPGGRGLAAPNGLCTDGKLIYFWAKDGIYSMVPLGVATSLTDADLLNLFVRGNDQPGEDVTYGGFTFYAPNYAYAASFRLAIVNSELKAHYVDSTGHRRTIVLDMSLDGGGRPRMAWSSDQYNDPISVSFQPPQPAGTLSTSSGGSTYKQCYLADTAGVVYTEKQNANDNGAAIHAALGTFELDGGDIRGNEQWADGWVNLIPASAAVTITPMSGGVGVAAPTSVSQSTSRIQQIISVGGSLFESYVGLLTQWIDNFSLQSVATEVIGWELTYFPQPITIDNAFGSWDNAGVEDAKYFQGFRLHADTFNATKGLVIRDADTLATHPFSPAIKQNGETIVAYSFDTPFFAHLVRDEPASDGVDWRRFGIEWIFQPTPERAYNWETQPTTHGLIGYHHIRKLIFSYYATAAVTLTITCTNQPDGTPDGTSPAVITLPSTGGQLRKIEFVPTFNKGMQFAYKGVSTEPWSPLLDKCEIYVGKWERSGDYSIFVNLGSVAGDQARV